MRFAVLLCALVWLTSCTKNIELYSGGYEPRFRPEDFAAYRGRVVYLSGVSNRAGNTGFMNYYGDGTQYGGETLTSFFWSCFKTGFVRAGVRVLEESSPFVSQLELELSSISEDTFRVMVTFSPVGAAPLRKIYSIHGPPVTSQQRGYLVDRAYHMMDMLLTAMLRDPDFQSAFVRSAVPQGATPVFRMPAQ